jgi:4-diphosphocytidyl-2-C-methyl-D-erythritol kinase
MRIEAPAKINLFLEVLGKRQDGYHEIVTVMQTVGIFDTLEVNETEALAIEVEGIPIPPGGENLVLKAARALAETAGIHRGARFKLIKRIPPGAGLGGGSSDAVAALLALNRVWGLKASREDLAGVAARVGSDLPFFLHGGTALCRGRGEIVEPLSPLPALPLLIVWPGLALSTTAVYEAMGRLDTKRVDIRNFLSELGKHDPRSLEAACFNRLEEAALKVAPRLSEIPRWMGSCCMTGSGSAFYRFGGQEQTGPLPKAWRVFSTST